MIEDLSKIDINIESIAQKALKNGEMLSELAENLRSKKETLRENSFNILLFMSEKFPEALYAKWDNFVDMLDGKNTFWRHMAVRLIANLISVDTENKFDRIFDKYYNLLNDSVIVAGHVTANSGKIAKAKPQLQSKITHELLNIDKTKQKHKDLIKAGAIESFSIYVEESPDKKRIMDFVKQQLQCESPKTRKMAEEFLNKWDT